MAEREQGKKLTRSVKAKLGGSEQLLFFIENAPSAQAMFDCDMRYLCLSRRWRSDYGLGERDLFQMSHYEIFPEIPERWKEVHRRGLGGEILRENADRFERSDGSVQWVRWEVRPWYNLAGQVGGIVIFSEDLTEHKQVEEALRISQERLALAASGTRTGMFDWNIVTGETLCNEQHARLLGLSTTTTTTTTVSLPHKYSDWADRVHPEDLSRVEKELHRCVAEHTPYEMEYRVVWPDSSVHWVVSRGTCLYDEQDRPLRMLGIVMDITERKRAEEALRESEARYRAIGESIDYGVWVCAPDGRNTYASESFLKMVGITQKECSDFGWGDVLHPDETKRTIAAWQECVLTGGVWDITHRFLGVDGQFHHVLARGVPVKNEHGEITCWAGINLDVTRLKQAEEKIISLNNSLEQRVQERTAELKDTIQEVESFSYSVSHDLRAPLRHINSSAAILCEDFGEHIPKDAHTYLEKIQEASAKMGLMVDSLLELSRVNRAELVLREVNLSALVVQEIGLNQELDSQRCIEAIIAEGVVVFGDLALMRQAIANLIGNACKYTSKNPVARIQFGVTSMDGEETFFVRDNGVGFDMTYKDKLFGAFERLHDSEFSGHGIGLATTQRIIKRHGGKIWGEGKVDGGATFYFTLPVYH